VREWQEDRVRGLAAEVAFFALLSMFPGLLALIAALGFLESIVGRETASRVQESVVEAVSDLVTDEGTSVVDAVEELFRGESPGLLTFGVIAALWAASRGFGSLMEAMAIVYDVEDRRSFLRRRALALALAVGTILLVAIMLAVVVIGPLFGRGADVADALGFGGLFATLWNWFRIPAALLVVAAWGATIYHLAPSHRTPWRWDLPGAALVAVLWVVETLGFRWYLGSAAGGNQVFGTLGGAIVLVFWLYLLAAALLLGGELNAILADRARVDQVTGEQKG